MPPLLHCYCVPLTFRPTPTQSGDQLEVVEGVNTPFIEKIINDQIPDGVLDTTEEEEGKGEEGEED